MEEKHMAVQCHIGIPFLAHINKRAKAGSLYHRLCSNGPPFKMQLHHRCTRQLCFVADEPARFKMRQRCELLFLIFQKRGQNSLLVMWTFERLSRERDITEKGVLHPIAETVSLPFQPLQTESDKYAEQIREAVMQAEKNYTADFRQFNLLNRSHYLAKFIGPITT